MADRKRAMGYADREARLGIDAGLAGLSRIVGATYEHGDGEADQHQVTLRLATCRGSPGFEFETLTKEVETLTATLGHQIIQVQQGWRASGVSRVGVSPAVHRRGLERCR